MKQLRILLLFLISLSLTICLSDLSAQSFLNKLKDKTEKIKQGVDKVKNTVEKVVDATKVPASNRSTENIKTTVQRPNTALSNSPDSLILSGDTVYATVDSIIFTKDTLNVSGGFSYGGSGSGQVAVNNSATQYSSTGSNSSTQKKTQTSGANIPSGTKKLKVLTDVQTTFPEAVPDTLLVLTAGNDSTVNFIRGPRTKSGDKSNYFSGPYFDIDRSFLCLKQIGEDSIYPKHDIIRLFDGNAQLWMPDTYLNAPDQPLISYPFIRNRNSEGMISNSSQIFINNPWTFIKIKWGFKTVEPQTMTITSNRGISRWLNYNSKENLVSPSDSSSTSVKINVAPDIQSLWLAVPGGNHSNFTINFNGQKYRFKDIHLKKGKNVQLNLKKYKKRDRPVHIKPGLLKVIPDRIDAPYSVTVISESDEKIGTLHINNEPITIAKGSSKSHQVNVDNKLEYFCFGLDPDVLYTLKFICRKEILKDNKKIVLEDTKTFVGSVDPKERKEIELTPQFIKPNEVEGLSCSCPLPEKEMNIDELDLLIKDKMSSASYDAEYDQLRIYTNNEREKGILQYVGNTEVGELLTEAAVLMTCDIITNSSWASLLNKNNPFLSKYEKEENYLSLNRPRRDLDPNFQIRKDGEKKSRSELIINNCNKLKKLVIANSDLINIEIYNCKNLETIVLTLNTLTDLHIGCCPKLKVIYAPANYIENLNIECCPELMALHVPFNDLTKIHVGDFDNLIELDCSHNLIRKLQLEENENLVTLVCPYNELTKVDLSENHKIKNVCCTANDEIELVVPEDVELIKFNLKGKLINRSKYNPIKFEEIYEPEDEEEN